MEVAMGSNPATVSWLLIQLVWKINPDSEAQQVYWEILLREEGFFFPTLLKYRSFLSWALFFFS